MAAERSLLLSPLFADLGADEGSDEQIQQLLREAETRLKSTAEESLVSKKGTHTP